MAYHSKEKVSTNLWYLDTGCSNHMSGQKEEFSELDETFRGTVRFGDNSVVSAMGKGKVLVSTKNNSIHTIGDVFYVPALKTNLLSAGQLQEDGYEINIKGGVCKIRDSHLGLIAQINMSNRLVPVTSSQLYKILFFCKSERRCLVVALRFGHLNFNGLRTLHQRKW
uniref:Putative ovule protein n=1 Tax=Solanum chacoense TaxID=4108 RepID=A0A0V0I0G2_SOLCH